MHLPLFAIGLAFALGFIGYLPLGNINLSVVQVATSKKAKTLWAYIIFIAFMELLYCVACLRGLHFLMGRPHWIVWMKWLAVGMFTALGLLSFFYGKDANEIASAGIKRGILVAIFNPLQAPFWMAWGVYMMENNLLRPEWLNLFAFGLITVLGTISVLWLYAAGGKRLVTKLRVSDTALHKFVGLVFIALAAWQFFKLILGK